ncbi:MAG: ABC transporter ATP-binding protein [Burkholderiales bacterium]|nr:ABC transporter ATP-binding protein [Burkholderiales bacterium]
MLRVTDLHAAYGTSRVLFGVALEVREGEVVALLGRNGMGKTTTIGCISGLRKPSAGSVEFGGLRLDQLKPHRIAHQGIGLVPEGRRIFPNLSVKENLLMAALPRAAAGGPWTLKKVIEFFPRLGERLDNGGNQLSGGEQQMLAIGRALMTNPKLLILDEATEGLAPLIRQEIWLRLHDLKQQGMAMLIVDKEVQKLAHLADRHYVLEKGTVVWQGSSAELAQADCAAHQYLAV